jgi:hypothetical protein
MSLATRRKLAEAMRRRAAAAQTATPRESKIDA